MKIKLSTLKARGLTAQDVERLCEYGYLEMPFLPREDGDVAFRISSPPSEWPKWARVLWMPNDAAHVSRCSGRVA